MRYVNNVGSHRQDNLLGRSQRYDAATIAILRREFDEAIRDF
jgi:hypothetical protein